MVRLREIPRTATFAWSPGNSAPWVVTGTKAGAVDVDFSNETSLELWDLALNDVSQGQELQPKVTLPTEVGFHDLAWTAATEKYPKGIIAGALDNGNLGLWDAEKLLSDPSNAEIFNQKIHSGAIKCLQFNPKIPNFLATGGAKGELFISDLDNLGSPIRLGSTAARADDIECLDWNKKVPNILVTGSSGGFVTVWDLKTKKESLTLNNYGSRKPVSAVAWDPEKPTRLITAVPLEQEPVILVYDLRNANAPEKVLKGHDSGVLSLSWCPQDSDLLLSCGKDNRTILWNPQTAEPYGDFAVVTNWTFQTRWNPTNPDLFATASFDGKLLVQTLQNANASAVQPEQNQAADGEDFFTRAQSQPQAASFSLPKAPKWLERPASVSFGFGGRLVSVKSVDINKTRASKISITKVDIDENVSVATDTFEKAIESGSLDELCESRISEARSDTEKADWAVMKTLLSKNPRKDLVRYLGFDETDDTADVLAKLDLDPSEKAPDAEPQQVNGATKGHRRFESVFATSADGDFLSQLAATQGTKTNNPFKLFAGTESDSDKKITKHVMLGEFEKALDVALAEERMSDAFMLAICGGEQCIKKAQEAYFAKQEGGPNYLRLLASVVGKNLWDTVHNADLENWKEVMATLCTFADEKDFPDLCEALGDRLEEHIGTSSSARQDAAFCYLAGSKLEKVVTIWIQELKEHENAGATTQSGMTEFSVHAKGLQDLIEKVTIFRRVVNFQDVELSKTEDWKLEALYNKYLEYVDIVSAHGQLAAAQKYLDLLPSQYPGADVARSRIQQANKKSGVTTAKVNPAARIPVAPAQNSLLGAAPSYQPPQNTFIPSGPQPTVPYATPQPAPFAQQSQYAPPGPAQAPVQASMQPANPYAPPGQQTSQPVNPYAPAGYQPPQQMRAGLGPQQGFGVPPPPRSFTQSPSVPPPSQSKNMTNWNDIPEGFVKPPTSRRSTPSVPPQQQPNQFTPGQSIPPPVQPPFGARGRASPAPPPPPKGMAAPPRVTSPLAAAEPPSSSGSNPYAPSQPANIPQSIGQSFANPPLARTASPYNAPPSGAPPPNRYAPAPGSQTSAPAPMQGRPTVAPPPQASQFQSGPPPVSNPYAQPRPPPAASPSPYAPQQRQDSLPGQPQPGFPPAAAPPPPMAGPPPSQPLAARPDTAGSQQRVPPPTPQPAVRKHPKGDRSHIPDAAQPIVSILSNQMALVRGRAPSTYKAQVDDTEKRLNLLFDHLNNEELLKPDTVQQIVNLSQALENRDFATAQEIQMDVHTNKVEECGQWMVGVKRLVGMCKAMG